MHIFRGAGVADKGISSGNELPADLGVGGHSCLATVQGGRAGAAIAVVLFHCTGIVGLQKYGGHAAFDVVTKSGDLGVDFFFVLSGFIILHAHFRDIGVGNKIGRYVWRRVTRIYPVYRAYLTALFVLIALGVGSGGGLQRGM